MATTLINGTKLEVPPPHVPLNRYFLGSIGAIFLLAMHFFQPNPGGSGLALSFNVMVWLFFGVTLGIGLYQVAQHHFIRYSKLTIGLWISCVLLSLPVLYPNSDISGVSLRLTGLWAGFVFFVLLQQFQFSNAHKQRLLWFILLGVLIEALFGLVQFLWLQPGNMFGYNTLANRPYGIFQQPNVMASFLATGVILSGYLLGRQAHKYNRKISAVILLYITPILSISLLVVLASRTGWIAVSVGVLLLLPYLYRFTARYRFIYWCLSVLIGALLGLAFLSNQAQHNTDFASHKVNLESPRLYTFPQAFDMITEKPFSGYGYGKFESEYILYTARQHQLNAHYPAGLPSMDHPHNEWLYWGVEGGVLPLFGILFAAALVANKMRTSSKGSRLALFALFVPIVLHTQLEYPFYHSAIHWLTFIILLYWIDQRSACYYHYRLLTLTTVALRLTSLVLPILMAGYLLTALQTNYVLTQFEKSNPPNPDYLQQALNPLAWQDRYDWDINRTYLNIGLYQHNQHYIQQYIDWSTQIIKRKPRPAFYANLILAYQGLGLENQAKQVLNEAQFLFPNETFSLTTPAVNSAAAHSQSAAQ